MDMIEVLANPTYTLATYSYIVITAVL